VPILVTLLLTSWLGFADASSISPVQDTMCGVSLVGPPDPFPSNPMPAIQQVHADWVAVIPFAYSRPGEPKVHYAKHQWQWWGERPEGCEKSIELAKTSGLKVMVKPQVYVPGSWPGGIDFESEAEWAAWEEEYRAYILPLVDLAAAHQVELFCIGTEFKRSTQVREAFWRALIKEIRHRFEGQLVYAANWDEFEAVPFWDALDYIGVDAYFPLLDAPTPSPQELEKAWRPIKKRLAALYRSWGRPVLFTEYGYLSVDGCASRTWELEQKVRQLPVNEQAQANAISALYSSFWQEPYWAGGFLWKWFPHMKGHEGYPEKDYTPQDKLAEDVLREWHQKVAEAGQ
jgi:hypothetical protein